MSDTSLGKPEPHRKLSTLDEESVEKLSLKGRYYPRDPLKRRVNTLATEPTS